MEQADNSESTTKARIAPGLPARGSSRDFRLDVPLVPAAVMSAFSAAMWLKIGVELSR